jgi:hypothetical protein
LANLPSEPKSIGPPRGIYYPNTIEYKATIEDEKVFSRPWDICVILHRHREANLQLIEGYRYTLEYNKYYPCPAESAPAANK